MNYYQPQPRSSLPSEQSRCPSHDLDSNTISPWLQLKSPSMDSARLGGFIIGRTGFVL